MTADIREIHGDKITAMHQLLHRFTASGCDELDISPISFVVIACRMWLEELSRLDPQETSNMLDALARWYDPAVPDSVEPEIAADVQRAVMALFARYDLVTAEVQGNG